MKTTEIEDFEILTKILGMKLLKREFNREVRIVTMIASAVVSIVTGLLSFTKCGEKWILL